MDDQALSIVDQFHKLYYESPRQTWRNTRWLGHRVIKCPLDLWIYQEILHEVQPDVVIETGTKFGGSALFLASICELLGHGEVLSIDIEPDDQRPSHPRITYITGSSTSEPVMELVKQHTASARAVLVILDSDHREEHVLNELMLYSPLVTPGSYIIVEDTNVNGHPVKPNFGPGPMEAVMKFLERNQDFLIDASAEKFLLTFSPRGYLKRRSANASNPRVSTRHGAARQRVRHRIERDERRKLAHGQ